MALLNNYQSVNMSGSGGETGTTMPLPSYDPAQGGTLLGGNAPTQISGLPPGLPPVGVGNGGFTQMTTPRANPGGPSTTMSDLYGKWAAPGQNPIFGVTRRPQQYIYNPNAFEYGGVVGGAENEAQRYQALGGVAGAGQAPQADLGYYNQDIGHATYSRGQQQQAVDLLRQASLGQGGPSAAEQQLQAGLSQGAQQRAQLALSARGGGGARLAAGQQAQQSNYDASAQGHFQAEQIRQQEMMNAQNAYASQLANMRSADMQQQGLAGSVASQNANLLAQQNQLAQQGQLSYEAMRQRVYGQQQQGQQSAEMQNEAVRAAMAANKQQRDMADASFGRAIAGGLVTAIGTIGGAALGGPAGAVAGGTLGSGLASGVGGG